jgi:DNA-binding MarR family transcriptional regulator
MVAKTRSPSTPRSTNAPAGDAAQSLFAAMGAARGEPCFCALARRAARGLTELYERELAPYGITLPQFSLLRATGALGPIGISDLAARLKLDRTTLGRNLKLLEKMSLVAMDGNSEDQRERLVRLTTKGARTSAQALAAWQAAQAKVRRGLSKEKLRALQEIVEEIDALAA